MGSGFSKMKKQAKQFQEQMQKMQQEMEARSYQGESGSGLVKVEINGKKELKKIAIDPQCIDAEEPEALEDLILAACHSAYVEVDTSQEGSPLGMGMVPPIG